MRRFILTAIGVFAVTGVAAAQQPQAQQAPAPYRAAAPAAIAGTPVQATSGTTVISGTGGCSSCGSAPSVGATLRSKFQSVTGGNCAFGYGCQSGCGSVKSDLAFHFGSCKNFFSPCGPTCNSMNGGKCGTVPFAKPFGAGWTCPRVYDSYANH
jgi:hypothetical protein